MKALRAEIVLMKEDTVRIVKDVQEQCIQSLVDLSANFNSAVDLIRNEFQAIMRAEREERLQDQQLQHENSVVLQGRCDHHREDINDLFGRYRRVRDQGNDLDEVQRVTNHSAVVATFFVNSITLRPHYDVKNYGKAIGGVFNIKYMVVSWGCHLGFSHGIFVIYLGWAVHCRVS